MLLQTKRIAKLEFRHQEKNALVSVDALKTNQQLDYWKKYMLSALNKVIINMNVFVVIMKDRIAFHM